MSVITLSGEVVKNALEISAKKDVRYYLNGIFLDAENKTLVSTEGHILYIAKNVETFEKSVILENFKVPAGVTTVKIEHFKDNRYIVTLITEKNSSEIVVKSIDGNYVNYRNSIESYAKNEECAISEIGFNLELLAKCAKVFDLCNISFTEKLGIAFITNTLRPDEMIAIMPANVDSNLKNFMEDFVE